LKINGCLFAITCHYRIDIMLLIFEGNVVEAINVVPEVGAVAGAVQGERHPLMLFGERQRLAHEGGVGLDVRFRRCRLLRFDYVVDTTKRNKQQKHS